MSFDEANIRYYKIVVKATDTNRYVALAEINMSYDFAGGEEYTPDEMTYYNFEKNYTLSTYGHLVEGNGYLTYNFTGTQFGFYVRQKENCVIEIEIDGQKDEITLENNNKKELAYFSSLLQNCSHNVKITVLEGTLSVESIIIR